MNDVAAALKLSKGGLYHHFQSKDEILFHIMSHAMDITEERVINVVRRIDGASLDRARADVTRTDVTEERLRTLIRLHIQLVLSPEDREITVMLHENHPLPPALRRKINGRKKDYLHFVEHLIADVQRKRNSQSSSRRALPPRAGRHDQLDLSVVQARRPADWRCAGATVHRYFFSRRVGIVLSSKEHL